MLLMAMARVHIFAMHVLVLFMVHVVTFMTLGFHFLTECRALFRRHVGHLRAHLQVRISLR